MTRLRFRSRHRRCAWRFASRCRLRRVSASTLSSAPESEARLARLDLDVDERRRALAAAASPPARGAEEPGTNPPRDIAGGSTEALVPRIGSKAGKDGPAFIAAINSGPKSASVGNVSGAPSATGRDGEKSPAMMPVPAASVRNSCNT